MSSSNSSSNSEVPENNATGYNESKKPVPNRAQIDDEPVFPEETATHCNDNHKRELNQAQVDDNSMLPQENATASDVSHKFRATFRFVDDCIKHILKSYGIKWEKPRLVGCGVFFNKEFGKAFLEITEYKRNFYRKCLTRLYDTFKDSEQSFAKMFLTLSLVFFSGENSEFRYWKVASLFAFAGECAHVCHTLGNPIGIDWAATALSRYIVATLLKDIMKRGNYGAFTKYCKQEAKDRQKEDKETPVFGEHESYFTYVVNRSEKLLSMLQNRDSTRPDFMFVRGYLTNDVVEYIKLRGNDPESVERQTQLLNKFLNAVKEEHKVFLEKKAQTPGSHVGDEGACNNDGTQASSATFDERSKFLLNIIPLMTHELYQFFHDQMSSLEFTETKQDVTKNQQPSVPESNVREITSDEVGTKLQQLAIVTDITETTNDADPSAESELVHLVTESNLEETCDECELRPLHSATKTRSSRSPFFQPQLRPSSQGKNVECETGEDSTNVQPAQEVHILIRMENPECPEISATGVNGAASGKITSKEIELPVQDSKSPQKNQQAKGPGKNKKRKKKR